MPAFVLVSRLATQRRAVPWLTTDRRSHRDGRPVGHARVTDEARSLGTDPRFRAPRDRAMRPSGASLCVPSCSDAGAEPLRARSERPK